MAAIGVVLFDLDDTVFDHVGARADGLLAHRRTTGLGEDEAPRSSIAGSPSRRSCTRPGCGAR